MSELEMKVEALMRCMPREQMNRVLAQMSRETEQQPMTEQELNRLIHHTLAELGTPAHVKGYRYLAYGLELVIRDQQILDAITKELYPAIAKEFQTTVPRVERAVRHAIEITWDRGDLDVLYAYFGNTVSGKRGKPTNSEFIAQVAKTIRLNMGGSR